MPRTVYALLVGIDQYPPPIPMLSGCANDINEFEAYLRERIIKDEGRPPQILTLRDSGATRAAVIAGFREHLSQSGKDDVALFYYSGHGSQEQAPEQFWYLEPDRLDETLVCYDSRMAGRWDLADKELGKLVDDLATQAGHVVVILDCCHSGSGTRGELETVRRAPTDDRLRPLDSFLPGVVVIAEAMTPRNLQAGAGWYAGRRGRHVLLAACRDDQTAKEHSGDGRRRGAFSYFLVDTLKTVGGELTYRDLIARTDSLVRSHIDAQTPQIEVVQAEDLDAKFLDGTIQPSSPYFIVDYTPGMATLRAGAMHGIARPTADGTTVLALFPLSARDQDLEDLGQAVGQAKVSDVQAATCRLQVSGLADPNAAATFKAIVVGLPTSRLVVRLEGEKQGVEAARTALESAGQRGGPSLYVREAVDPQEPAELRLLARRGQYLITRIDSDRPLAEAIADYSTANADLAVRRLEHIARWKTALRLENPGSGLGSDAVELTLLRNGLPMEGTDIRLEYQLKDENWVRPEIQIKLKNKSSRILYCALLGLAEDFEINTQFFPTGSQRLKPGEEAFANDNEPIPLSVPRALWDQGIIEFRDILKLIICTSDFDARLIAQPPLAQPQPNPEAFLSDEEKAARGDPGRPCAPRKRSGPALEPGPHPHV